MSHDSESFVEMCVIWEQYSKRPWRFLDIAAYYGNVELVQFLIYKGANVNAKNNAGKTPLDLAREEENTVLIKYRARHTIIESVSNNINN